MLKDTNQQSSPVNRHHLCCHAFLPSFFPLLSFNQKFATDRKVFCFLLLLRLCICTGIKSLHSPLQCIWCLSPCTLHFPMSLLVLTLQGLIAGYLLHRPSNQINNMYHLVSLPCFFAFLFVCPHFRRWACLYIINSLPALGLR